MPSSKNQKLKESYEKLLSENPEFILSRYSGLSVMALTKLRKKLKEKSACSFVVVKNNVFKLAIQEKKIAEEVNWDSTLRGPIVVAFTKGKFSSAAKVLKDYSEENQSVEMLSGIMESSFYDQSAVNSIASLPPKEELLARVMSLVNAPTVRIASGVREVMSSLARAITAVVKKTPE